MNHPFARRFSVTVLGALAASTPLLTGCEAPPPPVQQEAPPAPLAPQESEAEVQARVHNGWNTQLTAALAEFDAALAARNSEQVAKSMQDINMIALAALNARCELGMDRQIQDRDLQRIAYFQGVNVIPLLEPSLARADTDAAASRWAELQTELTTIRALFTQSDPAIAPEQRTAVAQRIADLEQRLQSGLALQAQQTLATNLANQLTAATAALAADTAAEADRAATTATSVEAAIATLSLIPTTDLTQQAAQLRTAIAAMRTRVEQRANAARLQKAFETLDRDATAAAGNLAGLAQSTTKATELARTIDTTALDPTAKKSLASAVTGLSARLKAQTAALQDTNARTAVDAQLTAARTAMSASTAAITAAKLPEASAKLTAAQGSSKAATALHGSTTWSDPKKSQEARAACDAVSAEVARLERAVATALADDAIARAMTAAESHLTAPTADTAAWSADITAVTDASRAPDATPAKRADAERMLARLTSAVEREGVLATHAPLIEKSLADKDIVLARAQIEDLRAAAAAPAIMDADRAKVNARADEFRNHVDALEHARNVTIGIAVIATVAVGVCGAIVALLIHRRRRAAKIHTPPDA